MNEFVRMKARWKGEVETDHTHTHTPVEMLREDAHIPNGCPFTPQPVDWEISHIMSPTSPRSKANAGFPNPLATRHKPNT